MIGQRRTSEHEHAHHFWRRRRLHSGRTIVARDGIASRQCLVGEESLLSTRFSSASPSLPARLGIAGSITRRSFACETLRRLVVRRDYLFLFDVRLLLVASVPA